MSDYEVYNPHRKSEDSLPVIYGFNNGGSRGWMSAVAIAEDGTCLGGHVCSDEVFMPYDLGIIKGQRSDRHMNQYQKHYPDGYRMDFVPSDAIKTHAALNRAFELNREQATPAAAEASESGAQ